MTRGEAVQTPSEPLEILDRIGAGDAYAAGILLGYMEAWSIEKTVAFALANARLAHTIQGDTPLMNRKQVERFIHTPDVDLIR